MVIPEQSIIKYSSTTGRPAAAASVLGSVCPSVCLYVIEFRKPDITKTNHGSLQTFTVDTAYILS